MVRKMGPDKVVCDNCKVGLWEVHRQITGDLFYVKISCAKCFREKYFKVAYEESKTMRDRYPMLEAP